MAKLKNVDGDKDKLDLNAISENKLGSSVSGEFADKAKKRLLDNLKNQVGVVEENSLTEVTSEKDKNRIAVDNAFNFLVTEYQNTSGKDLSSEEKSALRDLRSSLYIEENRYVDQKMINDRFSNVVNELGNKGLSEDFTDFLGDDKIKNTFSKDIDNSYCQKWLVGNNEDGNRVVLSKSNTSFKNKVLDVDTYLKNKSGNLTAYEKSYYDSEIDNSILKEAGFGELLASKMKSSPAEYAAIALDLASAGLSAAQVTSILGAGTGVAASVTRLYSDINEKNMDPSEAAKGFLINLGLDVATAVPVIGNWAKTAKVGKMGRTAKYMMNMYNKSSVD